MSIRESIIDRIYSENYPELEKLDAVYVVRLKGENHPLNYFKLVRWLILYCTEATIETTPQNCKKTV